MPRRAFSTGSIAVILLLIAAGGAHAAKTPIPLDVRRSCEEGLADRSLHDTEVHQAATTTLFVESPFSYFWRKVKLLFVAETPAPDADTSLPNNAIPHLPPPLPEAAPEPRYIPPTFTSLLFDRALPSTAASSLHSGLQDGSRARASHRAAQFAYTLAAKNYASSTDLREALDRFEKAVISFRFPQASAEANALAQKARYTLAHMEAAQIEFNNLTALGTDMIAGQAGSSPMIRHQLRFIDNLLSGLQTNGKDLTEAEEDVRNQARALLAQMAPAEANSAEQRLGQVILRQMSGMLSREYLENKFKGLPRNGSTVDWHQLSRAFSEGKIDSLLVLNQLRAIMNLLLFHTYEPRESRDGRGNRVPFNDSEFSIGVARDLEELEHFHRDGVPLRFDLARVLGGDMPVRAYWEKSPQHHVTALKPRVVTDFVFDMSGSMSEHKKEVFRNALLMKYLDYADYEVMTDQADHIIFFTPFTTQNHKVTRVADHSERLRAFQGFEEKRNESSGGTNITAAVIGALNDIIEHQKNGGEASHANLVLITDGEDNVDVAAIAAKLRELDASIEVAINVINLGDLNPSLRTFATEIRDERLKMDHTSFQHLSYDYISALMNSQALSATIRDLATDEIAARPAASAGASAPSASSSTSAPVAAPAARAPSQSTTTSAPTAAAAAAAAAPVTSPAAPAQPLTSDLLQLKESMSVLLLRRDHELENGRATLSKLRLLLANLDPGVEDKPLEKFIDEMKLIESTVMFQSYLIEERALFITDFLETLAKEYDLNLDAFVGRMTPQVRKKLRAWLGKE